jgi:cell division cycle protein 37
MNDKGVDFFRSVQRRIKESPSNEKPNTGAPNQPTYDMMMGQLLSDVWREAAWLVEGAKVEKGNVVKDGKKVDDKSGEPSWANEAVPEGKKEAMGKAVKERMEWHERELVSRNADVKKQIADEEKEQKKKITSEDISEGWSQTTVPESKPSPLEDKPKKAPAKAKEEVIEVLNPASVC